MFRGRGRGRGRGGSSFGTNKGLFSDGTWHCNCKPPLPAVHLKVKKEGPNTGRWFYNCQNKRCDFFLWEDDAKSREESAVLSNSRSEPRTPHGHATRAGPSRSSPPPPYTVTAEGRRNAKGQADSETEDEDEETFPWPPTGVEEAHVARQADAVSPPPVTPRKQTTSNAYPTPSTTGKRKISNLDDVDYPDLPTTNSSKKRAVHFEDTESHATPSSRTIGRSSGIASPQTTPTPSRFRDALSSSEPGFDLAADVFGVLQEHNVRLNNDTEASLNELLNRSSLRVQGIVQGRNVSRLQMKAKEARIAEQELRITTLEAELEAERAMVQHLRWERRNGAGPD